MACGAESSALAVGSRMGKGGAVSAVTAGKPGEAGCDADQRRLMITLSVEQGKGCGGVRVQSARAKTGKT